MMNEKIYKGIKGTEKGMWDATGQGLSKRIHMPFDYFNIPVFRLQELL